MNRYDDPAIAAINNYNNSVDNYLNSDERLQKNKDLLAPTINAKSFDKLIGATKGVREIRYINYNGTKIPLRLLSIKETREIRHATHNEFKKYPEFLGGEDNPIFKDIEIIKTISRATSACPEEYDIGKPDPFYTEAEIDSMPAVAVNYLMKQFEILNREYNLEYNQNLEDEINKVLLFIFDGGGPLTEKKLALLTGLTSQELLQIIIRFYNVITRLEDNARFITLLEESNQKEVEENIAPLTNN